MLAAFPVRLGDRAARGELKEFLAARLRERARGRSGVLRALLRLPPRRGARSARRWQGKGLSLVRQIETHPAICLQAGSQRERCSVSLRLHPSGSSQQRAQDFLAPTVHRTRGRQPASVGGRSVALTVREWSNASSEVSASGSQRHSWTLRKSLHSFFSACCNFSPSGYAMLTAAGNTATCSWKAPPTLKLVKRGTQVCRGTLCSGGCVYCLP
eukprot:TRINITY_DN2597_c0_g1_i1.p1 TRINITY_DN2597_c0_g1~~TRINITY_DN2597_c0_g1_i1.p1  ORF type:complete len:213 (+),score=11.46 TRINITY_DN2597_c0_g1_i1:86-724(+)